MRQETPTRSLNTSPFHSPQSHCAASGASTDFNRVETALARYIELGAQVVGKVRHLAHRHLGQAAVRRRLVEAAHLAEPRIRETVLGKIAQDDAIAQQLNLPLRANMQRARQFIITPPRVGLTRGEDLRCRRIARTYCLRKSSCTLAAKLVATPETCVSRRW